MDLHNPSLPDAALAYDRIAAQYDAQVQAGQWMRHALWDAYLRLFKPGQRVLDLSCGTGIDAIFLARHGLRVTGMDVSPGMLEQLRLKASRQGLADHIQTCTWDLNRLDAWSDAPFDGILSAFAGLNTLPDLAGLAGEAARLLNPGGHFVAHLLNRLSLPDWLRLVRRGRWQEARRRAEQVTVQVEIGGVSVTHYVYAPTQAYRRFFQPHFRLRRAYSLGWLRPLEPSPWLPPAVLEGLGRLERPLSHFWPFLHWGRFYVLELQKRENGSGPYPQSLHRFGGEGMGE